MIFDQYGNYIVQKLLQIAIEVVQGHREGDPSWLNLLSGTVIRNIERLVRYSSGKKIIAALAEIQPEVYDGMLLHRVIW
jgi:hypothetical protein